MSNTNPDSIINDEKKDFLDAVKSEWSAYLPGSGYSKLFIDTRKTRIHIRGRCRHLPASANRVRTNRLRVRDSRMRYNPHLFIGNKYHIFVNPNEKSNRPREILFGLNERVMPNDVSNALLKINYSRARRAGYVIVELPGVNLVNELERQYMNRPRVCENCRKPLSISADEYNKFPFCDDNCEREYNKKLEALQNKYPGSDISGRRFCLWCGKELPFDESRTGPALDFCKGHKNPYYNLNREFIKALEITKGMPATYRTVTIEGIELRTVEKSSPYIEVCKLYEIYRMQKLNDMQNIKPGIEIQNELRALYRVRYCANPECGKPIPITRNNNSRFCCEGCRILYNNNKRTAKKEKE